MSFRPSIKNSASAGASTIDTKDWPVSFTEALLSGELVAIEHSADETTVEYTVQATYNSDTNGEILSLSISPVLTYNVAVGDKLQVPNRREMSSALRTAIGSQSSSFAHFLEFQFSGGSRLINTLTNDVKMMNPDLGTPKVDGAGQSGTSLVTKDWIASAKVFRNGDTFWLGAYEYTCNVAGNEVSVEDCNSAWVEFNKTKADIILTHDASVKKEGSHSVKMVIDTACKKNRVIGYRDFSSPKDLSKYENIKYWIYSDVALNAGDIKLIFSTKKNCKNPIEYIPCPDMLAATWYEIDARFRKNSLLTSINSVGVMLFTSLSATTTIYIDDIRVYTNWVQSDASGGATIPLTTSLSPSPSDETLLKRNWVGFGGAIYFEKITETPDLKGNRMRVVVPAIDQTFVQILLAEHYIGRITKTYRAHFNLSTGALISSPMLLYMGYMNGGFKVRENRNEKTADNKPTSEIEGEFQDRISTLNIAKGFQTNSSSLKEVFPEDEGYKLVPELVEKIIPWGEVDTGGGGGCILATACLRAMGLSKDHYLIVRLKWFRDNVLAKTPEGKKLIEDYYAVTSRITREVLDGREDLFPEIYKKIEDAVFYIDKGEKHKAIKMYHEIINPLKEDFL